MTLRRVPGPIGPRARVQLDLGHAARRHGFPRAALSCLAIALAVAAAGCRSDPPLVACGLCGPSLVAADGDGVAVAQGRTLWRFSAAGEETSRTSVLPTRRGADVQAVAVTRDRVAWLGAGPVVIRVTPGGTLARSRRVPPAYVTGMVTDGAVVWMSAGRRVFRLAADGSVAARSARLGAPAGTLALAPSVVWSAGGPVALRPSDLVAVPGAGPPPAEVRPVAGHGFAVRDGDALWTLTREGILQRRDAVTGAPSGAPLDVGGASTSLAAGPGVVWVGLRDGGVVRVDAGAGGPRVAWTREVPIT